MPHAQTPHMLSRTHVSAFHSQVLPSKMHKGFVSFCNGLHWQTSHCRCGCPARIQQRVEEKAGPTLLGAENTTLHILGLMIKKMSLGRKRGREKKEGGQIKVLSLFQQSLVGALRISSERCVVFFVFFPSLIKIEMISWEQNNQDKGYTSQT